MTLTTSYVTDSLGGTPPTHSTLFADPPVDAVRAGSGASADPFDDLAFIYNASATTSLFVVRGANQSVNTEALDLVNGAVARLSDGRFVVVGETAGATVSVAILFSTGGLQSGPTVISTGDAGAADVAALAGGGFVVASQRLFGASQEGDIQLRFFNGAGTLTTGFSISGSADNDRNPQIATLSNGDVAVVWERGTTDRDIFYAVYQSNGSFRVLPTVLPDTGPGVDAHDAKVAATATGFVVVSELATGELRFSEVPNAGGAGTGFRLGAAGVSLTDASLGVMDNGFVFIAYDLSLGQRQTLVLTDARAIATSFDAAQLNGTLVAGDGGALTSLGNAPGGLLTVIARQLTRQVTGDGANDTFTGDSLESIVNAGAGNDTLNGGSGGETLNGGDGNDRVVAAAGDDRMAGSLGADFFDGGTGVDTVDYSGSNAAVFIDIPFGSEVGGHAEGDALFDVENVTGSAFNDRLRGGAGANDLRGGDGDDDLGGGAGADRLDGGAGIDSVSYSASNAGVNVVLTSSVGFGGDAEGDVLIGIENLDGSDFADTLVGDAGNNTLFGFGGDDVLTGGAGADTLLGGGGFDSVNYAASSAGVTVDLVNSVGTGGDAEGDTYSPIQGVFGSQLDDEIIGFELGVRFAGLSGDDLLKGGLSNDTLFGDEDDDTIEGGRGGDNLQGGSGIDTLSYADSTGFGGGFFLVVDLSTNTADGLEATGDTISGFENVTGSNFTDILTGDDQRNVLRGLSGNDRLAGGGNGDEIDGGAGVDEVSYAASDAAVVITLTSSSQPGGGHAAGDTLTGIENVTGSTFDDSLDGDGNANVLAGGAGNDSLFGSLGADVLDGGDGVDKADYFLSTVGVRARLDGFSNAFGEAAGDTLVNIEQVRGSSFNDLLVGSAGINLLEGISGDDTLVGGAGADRLDGGVGVDTAAYDLSTAGVIVRLGGVNTGGDAQDDTLIGIENLTGSGLGDTLVGDARANTLTGGLGGDTLQGGDGNDRLLGGDGVDVLQGGAGRDTLDGGAGSDAADYREKTLAVTLTLAGATATNAVVGGVAEDAVRNVESIYGGAGSDAFTGDAQGNFINGFAGNDVLKGGGGADRLLGGAGTDTADYRDKLTAVAVTLNGAINANVTVNGALEDVINGIEIVYGGSAADSLTGDALANLFRGGEGADVINGGAGVDGVDFREKTVEVRIALNGATEVTAIVGGLAEDRVRNVEDVYGGTVNDFLVGDGFANGLFGGTGNDTLRGLGGADRLTGGLGADVFQYNTVAESTPGAARDTIADFSSAQGDRIVLNLIDANSAVAGNQAFTVSALAAGQAGRLAIVADGAGRWLVRGDVDGNGVADLEILVLSATAPTATDFAL